MNFKSILILLLAVIIIGVLIWIFQGRYEMGSSSFKVTLPNKSSAPSSPYESYTATTQSFGKVHYVQLKDVICDAAPGGVDATPHVFKISLTFETSDAKEANNIASQKAFAAAYLRDIVKDMDIKDINNSGSMQKIKRDMKQKLNREFGKDAVKDVYFDEIIGQ